MAGMMRSKPQLPKSILDMKFMKRTKDRLEKEKRNCEAPKDVKPTTTEKAILETDSNFVIEPSYLVCEDLIDGRLSFKGMNPEIERLMELETIQPEDMEKDISDEQLARHFKKFKRNRDMADMDTHIPLKIKRENV